MRSALVVVVVLGIAAGVARGGDPPPVDEPRPVPADVVVCLQPIGTLGKSDAALVAPIGRGIELVFGFTVKTLPAIALPADAWYAPRKRYRAEIVLDHLRAEVLVGERCTAVLGVAAVDISTTKDDIEDWGILGLAYVDGGVGMVSSFRMKKGKVSRRKVVQRAIKVANHELGHVLGLPHMDGGPECMMNDAHGTVRTVDAELGSMCDTERGPIEQKLGLTLPATVPIDWGWIATGKTGP
jgi:archaemetzincin